MIILYHFSLYSCIDDVAGYIYLIKEMILITGKIGANLLLHENYFLSGFV